ncbi:MAG: GNAT family N-acetyltransferase [Nanoarchaeota archaeon]|nr:GNAT family N-acetyltransferase [Nanoarchaeota archaeon]
MQKADDRSREWAEKKAESWLSRPKNFRYIFVAEEKDRLIGFVSIKKFCDDLSDKASRFFNFDRYANITHIAVLPEFRRKKIGSLLLKKAEVCARKFKQSGVWLDCRITVVPFYGKNGYKLMGKYLSSDRKECYVLLKTFQ